jgi:hypothetical protein
MAPDEAPEGTTIKNMVEAAFNTGLELGVAIGATYPDRVKALNAMLGDDAPDQEAVDQALNRVPVLFTAHMLAMSEMSKPARGQSDA